MPLSEILSSSQDSADMIGQANKPKQKPVTVTSTVDAEGNQIFNFQGVDSALVEQLQSRLGRLQQIEQSYAEEAYRLKQQEQFTRQHGIYNLLSNLAGQFASAREMPGWVQALGRTSLAMNPPADVLSQQRLAVEGGLASILREEQGIETGMIGLLRTEEMGRRSDIAQGIAGQREQRLAIGQVTTHLLGIASRGDVIDPSLAENMYLQAGATPEQARTAAGIAVKAAQDAHDRKEADALRAEKKTEKEIASREKIAADRNAALLAGIFARGEQQRETAAAKEVQDKNVEARRSAFTLLDQIENLIKPMEEKGFLSGKDNVASVQYAHGKRVLYPGDPDLTAWKMHAGTMVSILRQLGDIGPRAIQAYQSAIRVIEEPTTAAGARQAMNNLREAMTKATIPPQELARVPKDGKKYKVEYKGQQYFIKDGLIVGE